MKVRADYIITFEVWNDNGNNKSMANAFKQNFTVNVEYDTDKEELGNVYQELERIAAHYEHEYIEKGFIVRTPFKWDISPKSNIMRDM